MRIYYNFLKRVIYLSSFLLLFFTNNYTQVLDNKGSDFLLTFLPNLGTPIVELHLTAASNTNVTIEYPANSPTFDSTVTVGPNNVTIIRLPMAASTNWTSGAVQNNAVHAFADEEFVCYMINRSTATSDAALALPVDVMNTEYIVLTYRSTIVSDDRSEFAVVAGFDNTTVTITPTKNLDGGNPAGVPFDITLDRGEAFFANGTTFGDAGDLTGTIITSDKPVGVTNGNKCTNVPPNVTFCDHIFEVAQPVQTWGNEIFTANLPNRPQGSVYRIIASEDNTNVLRNGASIGTIDRGEVLETEVIPGSHVFSSDNPIFVVQFMTGDSYAEAELGDPAMGNMIPSEQYLRSYTFSTVGDNQFVRNWVSIIARNSDVGSLSLDGAAVPAGDFTPIAGTSFSSALVEIESGSHSTISENAHGITISGINDFDSYLYPGGARFQFINPVGDPYAPVCNIEINGNIADGTVTDNRPSEDTNNNNVLDPGEDENNNDQIDVDKGVFFVVLEPGSENLTLEVTPFVPGAGTVHYTVSLTNSNLPGNGTVTATDGAGNTCSEEINLNGGGQVIPDSYIAVLLGSKEVPEVETMGSGGGMFLLNETQDTLQYFIRVCKLSGPITASHFHNAPAGTPGPVVKTITFVDSAFATGYWTSSDEQPLTPELVEEIVNGNIYVNVHTALHPAGEIRGQLTFDVPVTLTATLNGLQEVPANSDIGNGEGSFTLSGDGTSLDFIVDVQQLTGGIKGAHFHRAPAGVPGPVVRNIMSSFAGMHAEGTWTNTDDQPLTPELVADLLGCHLYVNIHTSCYPQGEVRGQIYKMEDIHNVGTTDVQKPVDLVTSYKLDQNFPNPFNPSTIIRFSIPQTGHVKLLIYNSLGEFIRTVVDEVKTAGVYQASFDARELPSGVYFYKLESGQYIQTNKMLLMK